MRRRITRAFAWTVAISFAAGIGVTLGAVAAVLLAAWRHSPPP